MELFFAVAVASPAWTSTLSSLEDRPRDPGSAGEIIIGDGSVVAA